MREIKVDPDWYLPETRRTDFSKEEILDIIDFYLQYKAMIDETSPHLMSIIHSLHMILQNCYTCIKWWMSIISII